jgi:hypothetical protein
MRGVPTRPFISGQDCRRIFEALIAPVRRAALIQDIRFAVRLLGRHPAFTAIAIDTLAVGIGTSTAAFTFFNAFVLRPFPVGDPEALVRLMALDRNGRLKTSPLPSIATSATAATSSPASSRWHNSPFR